jgi:chaperonin GroEL (HSP60 family)
MKKRLDDMDEFIKWGKDTGSKINDSAVFAGIVSENTLNDPMMALQIGYAVLLDKPIILIVDKSMKIPEGLTKIAKVIERIDKNNAADMKRASESVGNFAKQFR